MTTLNVLIPRQPVPALDVPLLGGGRFDLAVSPAPTFAMIVFYRGLHCPLCAKYLMELERLHDEFINRGVLPVAISSDTAERAAAMAQKLNAQKLRFGHDLPL
ncbi:MAG: redoxin domain-containing protein, partial [Rhodocyclaceae bacterium]|nr:redoxin domain-containing protein [Rhodocyclaceae bacterium]